MNWKRAGYLSSSWLSDVSGVLASASLRLEVSQSRFRNGAFLLTLRLIKAFCM